MKKVTAIKIIAIASQIDGKYFFPKLHKHIRCSMLYSQAQLWEGTHIAPGCVNAPMLLSQKL